MENTIKVLSKLNLSDFSTDEIIAFANGMEGVDSSFKSFLSTVDTSGNLMEQYQQHLFKANSQASKFSSTLKTVAANIGIMLANNLTIKGLSKAWDTLNTTVEEEEQKVTELKASYESLQSEYDTLSQKQDTTDAEKRRLEYLERRL